MQYLLSQLILKRLVVGFFGVCTCFVQNVLYIKFKSKY